MASKFFGQFLLEKGLLNKDQLLRALELQREANSTGELAEQGARRKQFGEILVEAGMLSAGEVSMELAAHAAARAEEVSELELGLEGHPLAELVTSTVNTTTRIFQRLLKVPCQTSAAADAPPALASYGRAVQIAITGDRPFGLAFACREEVLNAVALTFLGLPEHRCDPALARDAVGEVLNIIMGYVVKAALPEGGRYRAEPPAFDLDPEALASGATTSASVHMTSQLGPFALLITG